MNGDQQPMDSDSQKNIYTNDKLRSSRNSGAPGGKTPKGKQPNIAQQLEAFKNKFQNELSALKSQFKDVQEKNAKEALDTINQLKLDIEDLKTKCKEKEKEAVDLSKELENRKQEIMQLTKKYEDSLLAIVDENKKKKEKMNLLLENVASLKKDNEKLIDEMKKKEKECNECLESMKKTCENRIENQKKEHEDVLTAFVSKEEYNNLYDEYERVKLDLKEKERKLEKVIEAEKIVEKGQLEVIRQKESQKDEMIEFMRNFNRQNNHSATSHVPFRSRNFQPRFNNYSTNDGFPKRFKRH